MQRSPTSVRPTQRRGFDFTSAVRAVAVDMIARLPELSHIDLELVCVAFSATRNRGVYGVQASLTPLRFPGGSREGTKRGRRYRVQQVQDDAGREMLYILTLYLPRFMNLDLREKLLTVLHELWHIGPDFDGDIRRHPGRCYAHSSSKSEYDLEMGKLADRWLSLAPPTELYAFLQFNYAGLMGKHESLFGTRVARPKLIAIDGKK